MVPTTKVRTNLYIDKDTKVQAKELFKKFHISLSDAVNIFLSQAVSEQNLPFKIPNEETMKAIKEVENKDTEHITFNQLKEEMKTCITS